MMYEWNDGTDYLMHHGIKGQHWGIRRFQNPDGSYTEAGKERYRKELNNKFNSGKTIKYEHQWENEILKTVNTPRSFKQVSDSVTNPNIKRLSNDYINLNNKVIEIEKKESDKYRAEKGHDWTGDGTEFYNYLMKKSPEYKQVNNSFDKCKDLFIKEIKNASDNGEFDSIKQLKGLPNYVEIFKDTKWSKVGDSKAAVIGWCLSKGTIFPIEFEENREWSRRNGVGDRID